MIHAAQQRGRIFAVIIFRLPYSTAYSIIWCTKMQLVFISKNALTLSQI
jgi:hypothetical protein